MSIIVPSTEYVHDVFNSHTMKQANDKKQMYYVSGSKPECGMPFTTPALPELTGDHESILRDEASLEEFDMPVVSIIEYTRAASGNKLISFNETHAGRRTDTKTHQQRVDRSVEDTTQPNDVVEAS